MEKNKNYQEQKQKLPENENSRAVEIAYLGKGGLESVNYPLEELQKSNFNIKAGKSTFGLETVEDNLYLKCDKGYYPLDQDKVVIVGREKANSTADVEINDKYISGEHFAISVYGDEIAIRDLESKNGTQVEIGQKTADMAEDKVETEAGQEYEIKEQVLHDRTLVLDPEKFKDLFIVAGETKIEFKADEDDVYLESRGQKIVLNEDDLMSGRKIVFGRNDFDQIDKTMSNKHFSFRIFNGDKLAITDEKSTNKTYVNYKKLINKS